MVRALERACGERYEIRVLVPGGGGDYEYGGVAVHRFITKSLPCGLAPFLFKRKNQMLFGEALARIGVRLDDIAFCHAHTSELAYVTEFVKKHSPNALTLLHHHCINPIRLVSGRLGVVPLHATWLYFYLRHLCEQVDVHVFCSEQSRRSYAKMYRKNTPECGFVDFKFALLIGRFLRSFLMKDSLVLYNGIDSSVFHPHDCVRKESSEEFVIGCVGNFQPLKDQITLIKAVERLRMNGVVGVRVRFVGSGQTLAACRQYVCEHGLSDMISFETEMPHDALVDFYNSLDLFVLPSRTEGFCCAYVEAIGCGVPVMGCRGVSVEEVIPLQDRNRWLITPKDYIELAKKILDFMENRWEFHLSRNMEIDGLMMDFLQKVECFQKKL